MNKYLVGAVAILLLVASFFVGYSVKDSDDAEIQSLQTQIESLRAQSNAASDFASCDAEIKVLEDQIEALKLNSCDNGSEDWEDVVELIKSGKVDSTYETGDEVSLYLKDGTWVRNVKVPAGMRVQDVILECGEPCEDIAQAQE